MFGSANPASPNMSDSAKLTPNPNMPDSGELTKAKKKHAPLSRRSSLPIIRMETHTTLWHSDLATNMEEEESSDSFSESESLTELSLEILSTPGEKLLLPTITKNI